MKSLYLGIMTGTSLDGVDIALCRIDETHCEALEAETYPFEKKLARQLRSCMREEVGLMETLKAQKRLSEYYVACIERFAKEHEIDLDTVEAIGIHGQTILHKPEEGLTLQIVDPGKVAVMCGTDVVADFRRQDVALGGEGAPLAPIFHRVLFAQKAQKIAVVNIGGIANVTILDDENVSGYDTGPGNALLDLWVRKHLNLPFDKEGKWAREGKISHRLLVSMKADAYFAKKPPKSLDKRYFDETWLEDRLKSVDRLSAEDVQRTLLELTVQTICEAIIENKAEKVVLCGGGAYNGFLVERIKALLGDVETTISEQAAYLEAMMTAWLAYARIRRKRLDMRGITGALRPYVSGGWYAGGR